LGDSGGLALFSSDFKVGAAMAAGKGGSERKEGFFQLLDMNMWEKG
jgi:hypothetical protein